MEYRSFRNIHRAVIFRIKARQNCVDTGASAAKAGLKSAGFSAALEALRHPNAAN